MKLLVLVFLLIMMSSCQSHSKSPEQSDNEELIETKIAIDTIALKKAILKKYSNARDIKIFNEYLSNVSLFWSDPGYVKGPTISVNAKCWKISFSTDSFNDDSSLRYTDDYEYYILKEDSIAFMRNSYHGKGYHGGSFILMKNEMDLRYNDLSGPIARAKDEFTSTLEILLKK